MGWGTSEHAFKSGIPSDGHGEESDNFVGSSRSSEPRNTAGTDMVRGPLLNASSSVGAGSMKVSKKRSRASRRPPTTVLEADSSNFRSMVQQLTGIPTPPPALFSSSPIHTRFSFLSGTTGLVRPQPTRPYDTGFPYGTGMQRVDEFGPRLRNYMHPVRGLFQNSVLDKPLPNTVQNGNIYGHQGGGNSVWDDSEGLNARVKREEEVNGRPIVSWSTSL